MDNISIQIGFKASNLPEALDIVRMAEKISEVTYIYVSGGE